MKKSEGRALAVKTLLFGGLVVIACSGKTGGSESNFITCKEDRDCASGSCVDSKCAEVADSGTPGAGGAGGHGSPDAGDSGGGPAGGLPNLGGFGGTTSGGAGNMGGTFCNAGGAFVFTGGFYGAGGNNPGAGGQAPTCPVDGAGFATVDPAVFCNDFACPDTAAGMLHGLTCNTEGVGDIMLTVGCGRQKIRFLGPSLQYSAWMDVAGGSFLAAEAQLPYPFGTCNANGYRTGTAPADCVDDKTYACTRTVPITECRSPNDPGCSVCCSEYGGYCNFSAAVPGSEVYDWGTSSQGACPCNCPQCATCTPDQEEQLRTLPAHPECNCPHDPPPAPDPNGSGGTPGAGGGGNSDPCPNICGYRAQLQRACPGVTP